MSIFSRIVNRLPKKLIVGVALGAIAIVPVAAQAASTVTIESSLGVANVTKGDTNYSQSVNASYDQVVKFQVYYHNRELPDSGLVANNLRVKINIPSQAGSTQTVTSTVAADNSNTVNSSATVNTGRADAYLQYIPGSAVWRHNVGTNDNVQMVDTSISDSVVTGGQGLVLENEKPCYNFAATVTVLARVMVPGVKVVKQVEKLGQSGAWAQQNTANPGDTLKYMITYQNIGNTVENNVIIGDNLPPKMTLVKGTTLIYNSNFPNGTPDHSDNIANGGINIGNYNPGATGYVVFEVKVPAVSELACGNNEFRNVGVAQPQGMTAYYNTAITDVAKQCKTTPPPTTPTTPVTPTTPKVLPNTGAGNVIGLFGLTTIVGAVAHRLFVVRRLARK